MKMNFKYAMLACAALLAGFTSCSSDDNDAPSGPVKGAKTYARITLTQEGTVTRGPGEYEATAEESYIDNAKLFVFGSDKVLEQVVDLVVSGDNKTASEVFETTVGLHYFVASANAPAIAATPGNTMEVVQRQLIENISNATELGKLTTANKFFMTSGVNNDGTAIDAVPFTIVEASQADAQAETKNKVGLGIGRAMAKFNMIYKEANFDDANYEATAAGKIEDGSVKYAIVNNPTKMNYFPYFDDAIFKTPEYDWYGTDAAPDRRPAPTNYWPTLATIKAANIYKPTTGVAANAVYGMENSNELPTYGNATLVSVQAVFLPTTVTGAQTGKTFYRVFNKVSETFEDGFFGGINDAAAAITTFATNAGLLVTDFETVHYIDGICYYVIPVKDARKSGPICYNVLRNHYYEVKITGVTGCGMNEPGGEGTYPGTTDPTDPIDEDKEYYMKATITVKPWVYVQQEEDLKGV